MAASQQALKPRQSLLALLVRGVLTGLFLALLVEVHHILIGDNFRVAAPGLVYRCAQLSPQRLAAVIEAHGIRTVINLRGCCEPEPWYLEQGRVLGRLNVSQEDLGCSAGRLPSTYTISELVKILDHTDYPILVHCHRGIDRTGLVVAVALLLRTDTDLDEALSQLTLRFAHLPVGKTGNMDRFFWLYREWLAAAGRPHSREAFRHWIEKDYCPGECRARIEVLGSAGPVLSLPQEKPAGVRVRCTNISVKPWHFKPGTTAGIHLHFLIHAESKLWARTGRAGLLRATVAPGESIELTLALPALPAGHYILRADLIDEQHASFFQAGSEPLIREVVVE